MDVALDRETLSLIRQAPMINLCCILIKSYLYFCKTQQTMPVIEKFTAPIIKTIIIEKNIAEMTNKMQKFNTNWCVKD